MSVEKDIRYELLARLCPNSTGMYFNNLCMKWDDILTFRIIYELLAHL